MSALDTLDVGQASELKLAFRRTGWSNEELKRLCEGDLLKDVRAVLLGRATVQVIEHLIDCDADPFVPSGWTVESHQQGGQLVFDHAKVTLYLSNKQQNGGYISGNDLRKELRRKRTLNANVLDYLLKNPHLIPEEWKGKYIFFWGTIYRYSDGGLCVRYLCFHGGGWRWLYGWLDVWWYGGDPAVAQAS